MNIKRFLALTLLSGLTILTACLQPPVVNDDDGEVPTVQTVSILSANGDTLPQTLISGQLIALSANSVGTGDFNSNVTWTSKALLGFSNNTGSFDPNTGQVTQFTAPIVTVDTAITVTATSLQDTTKSGKATFIVKALGTVSSVEIKLDGGGTAVTVGSVTKLLSTVTGTGGVNPDVTWTKTSGEGQFYDLNGDPVETIVAANVSFKTSTIGATIIKATSVQDSSKFAEFTVNASNPTGDNTVTGLKLEATKVAMFTGQTTTITATANGTGNFNKGVNLVLEAGDGTLQLEGVKEDNLNRKATYTSSRAKTAIISATSVANPSIKEFIFISVDPSKKFITAGQNQSIVINKNGLVFGWGANNFGQITEDTGDQIVPKSISGIAKILSVSGGVNFSMAMTATDEGGETLAWGSDASGQIGRGTFDDSSVKARGVGIPMNTGTVAIDTDQKSALGIRGGGGVYCWGLDTSGQCNGVAEGDGVVGRPKLIELVGVVLDKDNPKKPVVGVAAGCEHSLFSDDKGQVFGWGKNTNGQLAQTTGNNLGKKIKFGNGGDDLTKLENRYIAIAAAGQYSLLLNAKGQVRMLSNGIGSNGLIANLNNIVAITAGGDCADLGNRFALALNKDGNVFRINASGSVTQIDELTNIVAISAGEAHVLALEKTGRLFAFGENADGQLGIGDQQDRTSPVEVKLGANLEIPMELLVP
jgi:alpha-tubulin suppressor-like RCC1 family protein